MLLRLPVERTDQVGDTSTTIAFTQHPRGYRFTKPLLHKKNWAPCVIHILTPPVYLSPIQSPTSKLLRRPTLNQELPTRKGTHLPNIPVWGRKKTHHCGVKGCKYNPAKRNGPGYCKKHQWLCSNTRSHGKGNHKWYMMLWSHCGGCGAPPPK